MNAEILSLSNRLLSALASGACDGLLLFAVAGLGLKLLPKTNAATRHAVILATLISIAIFPAVHFFLPSSDHPELFAAAAAVPHLDDRPALLPETRAHFFSTAPIPAFQPDRAIPDSSPVEAKTDRSEFAEQRAPSGNAARQRNSLNSSSAIDPSRNPRSAALPQLQPATKSSALQFEPFSLAPLEAPHWTLKLRQATTAALAGGWLLIVFIRLGILAGQYSMVRSWKRHGIPPRKQHHQLFDSLCAQIGLRRKPLFLACPAASTPIAAGFLHPAVLIPSDLLDHAGPAQFEQILRHELAHLARADDWTNLIQQLIKSAFFFHPAVWWLSSRLTLEQEIACDDHVLAATAGRRDYALFLVEFAGRARCRRLSAAPAGWRNKRQLNERINMILNSNRNASPRLQGRRAGTVLTAAAVIAVLVISAAPRLSFGQAAAPARLPGAASESAATPAAPPEANIPADTAPPLSGSRIAPSGARPKPNPVPGVSSAGTALPGQPPTPPSAPAPSAVLFSDGAIAVASPAAPMVALSGPLETPAPPNIAVRPRRSSEDSIERRLERLERLVEALVARDKNAKLRREDSMHFNYDLKTPAPSGLPGKDKPFKLDHQDLKLMMDLGVSNEEILRIKEQALKQAETAVREAQRAAAAANASAAEAIRRSRPVEIQDPANVKQQIQALETQRHLLEKELKGIEKQIERMQQEQEKLQQDLPNKK